MTQFTFEQRREALWSAVMNVLRPAKDPVKAMKRLTKKHGELAGIYHCAAYETQNPPACIAALEARADEYAARINGWKTLEQIREESLENLRNHIAA